MTLPALASKFNAQQADGKVWHTLLQFCYEDVCVCMRKCARIYVYLAVRRHVRDMCVYSEAYIRALYLSKLYAWKNELHNCIIYINSIETTFRGNNFDDNSSQFGKVEYNQTSDNKRVWQSRIQLDKRYALMCVGNVCWYLKRMNRCLCHLFSKQNINLEFVNVLLLFILASFSFMSHASIWHYFICFMVCCCFVCF